MARTDAAAGPLGRLRVLVAHEWLVAWAGSERVVEEILTAFPEADVVVGVRRPDMADGHRLTTRARETWLGRVPGARAHHRWFLPLQGLAFASLDTSAYDLVISSSHAFSKMVRARPGAVHLCYCHSPPRYLWDLRDAYRRGAGPLQRAALAVSSPALRRWDRHAAGRVDHFLANSRFVASRVRRAYGRRATVVYPPVSPKGAVAPGPRGDFLLSLGRLVPYKRVDLAIAAAERLGRRLIVAGDGPDRPRLERLAGRRTEFAGAVSEAEAGRLLSTCAAFVFCAEEDFGIAPVEANAHGAPVVAYRAGGVCESMADGVTAEFFDRQEVEDVAAALARALDRSWDQAALAANAARFSPEVFRGRFRAAVEAGVRRYGGLAVQERVRAGSRREAAARLTVARGDA
jgi:glycosyltransferase involved in cell wall biosynthesis